MDVNEVIQALQAYGTEQNRKVYRRHGVGENQFGVSFANLKALKKQIKTDHALAQQLWASGNHEARLLALMIADPQAATLELLQVWVQDLDNYVITDAFSAFASQTPFARQLMARWTEEDGEWVGQAGWDLLAHLAMKDAQLPEAFFEPYLNTIEAEIHTRKNRVRHAMNSALIAIGIRTPALEQQALAAAQHIGKVQVDHGQTSCKTPDATAYIRKTLARKRSPARG
ncbi:MAG: DNA alkylation repair protein [Chloroflexota bacterium]